MPTVIIRGEFLGLDKWDFEGKTGYTASLLQDSEVTKIGVTNEDVGNFPKAAKLDAVEVEARLSRGFEGKGFKLRFRQGRAIGKAS